MLCLENVAQPNTFPADEFKRLFQERLPDGEIYLDEECSIQADRPDVRLWRVYFLEDKRKDFMDFLREYANLKGFAYRENTLKYPR
ncbi:MAG: hypothetical protein G01um1014106_237 [Parcubacteria group bacterium Gr01-1014_106]|nr:MAG: hypothetical protein G01um1014106_237 [Parcubacteria group bacterium Gr01-1014_106]